MENQNDKEILWTKRVRNFYFAQLIKLNQIHQTSTIFAILLEAFRFILGHSFVYCLFIATTLDNTPNGALFASLKHLFFDNPDNTYQWLQLFSFSLLLVMVLFLSLFCLGQRLSHWFNSQKLLYYTKNVIKAGAQFTFALFAFIFYRSIATKNYFMIAIVLVEMMMVLFLFKVSAFFDQNNKFQTEDLYAHNENFTAEVSNILFCLICFIGPYFVFIGVPEYIRVVIVLLWLILQGIRIKNTAVFPYYQNELVQKLYVMVVCIQSAQISTHALFDLIELNMLKNNVLPVIVILSVFLIWGLFNYGQSLMEKSYFINLEDIRSRQQLYLFINSYYYALECLEKSNDLSEICLIVSSIRRNHQNTCKNLQCYCYKQNQLKHFLKAYLYELILRLEGLYSHNQSIMLYIYSFKFHVFHHYARIYQQIDTLQKMKEMSFFDFFLSMKLKQNLKKWIQIKSKQHKVIKVCRAIRLQQDIALVNEVIISDVQIKYKKWSTLSKELSRIQQIRTMSNRQIQNMIEIQNFKAQKWQFYNRSPVFNAILYFYFKKIVLRNCQLNDLEQNIRDLSRKIKQEEYGRPSLFSKYLFCKNACTIECSLKQSNLGMIINTSRSITQVFGYNTRKIIGQNLSSLYPSFLANEHSILLKKWTNNGSCIEEISFAQEIYCQNKDKHCFMAQRYMNLYTGSKQITLNCAFIRKNQSDLVLINSSYQLQSYGGSLKPILKHIPGKIYADFVFKEIQNKISNADINQDKLQKTIIYNQTITNAMIHGNKNLHSKNKSHSNTLFNHIQSNQTQPTSDNKQKSHKPETNKQVQPEQSVIEFEDVWKMNFLYKKAKLGSQFYFKIQVKALEHVKDLEDINSGKNDTKEVVSQVNHGGPSCTDNIVENQVQMMEIGEQENSSMTSYSSQLGYGVSKLISHFSFLMLNPSKLSDKRLARKYFLDVLFTFMLVAILSTSLVINKYSLQERTASLNAKSSIDKVLHLIEASMNHVYTMYAYINDPEVNNIMVDQSYSDQQKFFNEFDRHLFVINQQITFLQGEVLFDYLKRPLNITFPKEGMKEVQILQFFKIFFYLFKEIRKEMQSDQTDINLIKESFRLLNLNDHLIRMIREGIAEFTESKNVANNTFNRNYLIINIVLFFAVSGFYAYYINNHRNFRFHQQQDHIKLYQMIPHEVLKSLNEYYLFYYRHFVLGKNKIDSVLNEETKLFQKQLEEITDNQQLTNGNKIKLIGKRKYWIWIGILFVFLAVNGGNGTISYNMYTINKQIEYFSKLANQISASQSLLFTRYIRLRATYYFERQTLDQTFIDFLLTFIQTSQVKFNTYSTFEQNWVTERDSEFRNDFNYILTANPCQLNRDSFTSDQIAVCNQEAKISEDGIITFTNSLSRTLRNVLLEWKSNLTNVMSQKDALIGNKQFRQVDLASTFHVDTFQKLYQKIGSVYNTGFQAEYQTYLAVFVCLILCVGLNYIWNFYESSREKQTLSYLYGYVLLFPASTLKHSKYLLKFIQGNIEFSEKH